MLQAEMCESPAVRAESLSVRVEYHVVMYAGSASQRVTSSRRSRRENDDVDPSPNEIDQTLVDTKGLTGVLLRTTIVMIWKPLWL